MKRFCNLIPVLFLLLVLIPFSVNAAEGPSTNTSGSCGPNAKYTFNTNTGALTITGTGEMYSVESTGYGYESSPWSPLAEQIKTVTIGNGITIIGDEAFYGCSNLTSVTIPDSVKEIGREAFVYCTSLNNVDLPASLTFIGEKAFMECTQFTEVIIPEGVIYINDYAFDLCENIATISLPSTVESIGSSAFDRCKALTSITIPESVTQMEGAFTLCDNLKEVTIYSGTVSIMERDFISSEQLSYIHIIGDAPVSGVTNVFGDAQKKSADFTIFYDEGTSGWTPPQWNEYEIQIWGQPDPVRSGTCGDNVTWMLKDGLLTISGTGPMDDFNATNAYEAGAPEYGFFQRKIKEVVIEEGVTRIGTNAFNNCAGITDRNYANMTTVTIPSTVTEIGDGAFEHSYGLTTINLSEGLLAIQDSAFYDCPLLEVIHLPSTVTTIENRAFMSTPLKSINLSDSITFIGEDAFNGALEGQHITIPKGMTEIGLAAFQQSKITGVDFHDGVTRIEGSAFRTCVNLKTVTIPGSVTYLGGSVFADCENLESIYFLGDAPEFDPYVFSFTTATAYYPENNATWTEVIQQSFDGSVTWAPNHVHDYTDVVPVYDAATKTHTWDCLTCDVDVAEACSFTAAVTADATASTAGITTYTCTLCGGSYEEEFYLRLAGSNRYQTAFLSADQLKAELGVDQFENIVVASGTGFADALAGSYLAVQKNAPILLVNKNTTADVADYIEANLAEGGTVYLLGGEAVVPAAMEEELAGLNVERLAGANRYETNLLILAEAGFAGEEILVCTGNGFADSLSASAVGKPILLVNKSLNADQLEFVESTSGEFVIIGGENAVSAAVEETLTGYGTVERLAGDNRYETSVLVAEYFFDAPTSAVVAYSQNFPDGLCGGPLAAATNSPLLLMATNRGDNVIEYAQKVGISCGAVLGGIGLIDDATAKNVFSMK